MKHLVILLLATLSFGAKAQTNFYYFIQFHDKNLNYVELEKPENFLSERSLTRRTSQNVKIDSFDLPVTLAYLDNIKSPNISILYASKWLNGAVISVKKPEDATILKIKFFVDEVVYLGKSAQKPFGLDSKKEITPKREQNVQNGRQNLKPQELIDAYGQSYNQINMINGIALHQLGLEGQGMWIAVFDAGFYKVNSMSAFENMFAENRVINTYDLVDGGKHVYEDADHGLNVLGVMAANNPKTMIGSAPKASYVLFRTESKDFENLLEELNWVRAAEIADSLGVDIIHSSLGYNKFDEAKMDHNQSQLDGKTAFISRGAAVAASRGMLVINSAGNDGNKDWKKINFPSDADGILVVGAVDSELNPPAFSSFGPTADFRIKPDVAALGYQTTITTSYGVGHANGTSFSAPLISGMMACLWQADKSKTPAQLISIINRTGHITTNPDNVIGHGVPDFYLAYTILGKNKAFDYSKPQSVYTITDTIKNGKMLTIHAPTVNEVEYTLKENRKFLIFKYQKSLIHEFGSVAEDGFVNIIIKHSKSLNNTPVSLSIISKNQKEKQTLLKASFILSN